ncbi:MAG: OmpA family protein [Chitinophagaceae bacterium]|nr:OmpA family protein [Chitinophagaceae bacterium]
MKGFVFFLFLIFLSTVIFGQQIEYFVYFDHDKFEIPDTNRLQLYKLTFKKNIQNIELEGHCDSTGDKNYNLNLSKKRASEVKKFLMSFGIPTSLIKSSIGFGENKLINNHLNEAEKLLNRRVLVKINLTDSTIKNIIEEQKQQQLETIPLDVKSFKIGKQIVLENLLFEGGRHILLPSSFSDLKKLLKILKETPSIEIEIQGHVCCTVKEPDGFDFDTGIENLSEARAETIKEYLVQNGIKAERLTTIGFGGTKKRFPEEKNIDEQNKNKRVEIKILKQ